MNHEQSDTLTHCDGVKKRTSLNVITKEWHATVNNKQSQSGRALCENDDDKHRKVKKRREQQRLRLHRVERESDVSTTKFFAYLIILLLLGVLLCVFIHSRHFIYSSMRNSTDRMLKGSLILLSSLRLLAHSS